MHRARHPLGHHVQKSSRLSGHEHPFLAENEVVRQGHAEVLEAPFLEDLLANPHPVVLLEVRHRFRVAPGPRLAVLVGVADNLAAVLLVAPRVVAKLRVDREVKPPRVEAQLRLVVLLADNEPVDAVAERRVQLRDDLGARAVGGDHVLRPIDDLLAAGVGACAARPHQHVLRARLDAPELRALMDLRPALFHDMVVGELAVNVRGRARDERHPQLEAVREQEVHAGHPLRRVERILRRLAEILLEEPVPARREDAGADLMARKLLALDHHRVKPRVDRALCGRRAGEARADDEDVRPDLGHRRHSVMNSVSRPEYVLNAR